MQTHPAVTSLSHFITKRWLVCGYLALLTGLFWLPSSSAFTKVFYALVAFPSLLALVLSPKRCFDLLREPTVQTFLALSAWMLMSLAWSRSDDDLSGLAKRPLYLLMLISACSLIALQSRTLLLGCLRTGAALAALAATVSLTKFLLAPSPEGRFIGTGALSNPLLTSHVFGMFCTYWIATWLSRDMRHDWLPVMMATVMLLALLATGSRTPLMALMLTCLWMLLMAPRRAIWLVAAIAVAGAACLILFPELLLQRGVSFRPQIWAEAWRQAQESLWIGHGYDTQFSITVEGSKYIYRDPHNVELAVLLELGFIGLGLWLAMYGVALSHCIRQRRDKAFQIASALMIYGLSAGLTEGSSFMSRPNENWFLIWIPLSLVIALAIQQRSMTRA